MYFNVQCRKSSTEKKLVGYEKKEDYRTVTKYKCCEGWKKSSFFSSNKLQCDPVCEQGCTNGYCVAPNKCNCSAGYKMNNNNKCKPVCEPECVNSICIGINYCDCLKGYVKSESNPTECVPNCSNECENGFCKFPEKCECNSGYGFSKNSSNICHPICADQCVNGECVSPNKCRCFDGYIKNSADSLNVCDPICTEQCVNGECVSPDECRCFDGFDKNITDWPNVCNPICEDGCKNGHCVAPGKCECNEGFESDTLNPDLCIPFSYDGECKNGLLTDSLECNCLWGYTKENVNDGLTNVTNTVCSRNISIPQEILGNVGSGNFLAIKNMCIPQSETNIWKIKLNNTLVLRYLLLRNMDVNAPVTVDTFIKCKYIYKLSTILKVVELRFKCYYLTKSIEHEQPETIEHLPNSTTLLEINSTSEYETPQEMYSLIISSMPASDINKSESYSTTSTAKFSGTEINADEIAVDNGSIVTQNIEFSFEWLPDVHKYKIVHKESDLNISDVCLCVVNNYKDVCPDDEITLDICNCWLRDEFSMENKWVIIGICILIIFVVVLVYCAFIFPYIRAKRRKMECQKTMNTVDIPMSSYHDVEEKNHFEPGCIKD